MTDTISTDDFRAAVTTVLDELSTHSHNQVLDENQSFLETLADITAAEASIPVSGQSGTLAAQVNHVQAFVGWLNRLVKTGDMTRLDWAGTWKVTSVTDAEWTDLVDRLRTELADLRTFATSHTQWDAQFVLGAFQITTHIAYHLGEVRQGIGVIRHPTPR